MGRAKGNGNEHVVVHVRLHHHQRFLLTRSRMRRMSFGTHCSLANHFDLCQLIRCRQTLQGIVRPASPTAFEIDDDSSDNIDLQPEFMLLAQKARDNAHRGSSQAPEGVGDEIVITVKWYPHPLDATGKREDWQYKIDRVRVFASDVANR